ncbi:putative late blight resistance proteinR1B-8 [Sesamum alatum]|uniref:Late blight resistance proteinR1B-8 n=1 Tax=Sesamum alatum TaxID=300844 RepID=A0AAE2CX15_9LAMI|nr:putative late blight resistance proteinR1B-8 [Sesamum alatum]
MAVAAYEALLSLSHVLENVQLPARRSQLHLDTQRLRSLQEKVEFLRDFLEFHSQRRSQEMEGLARQITVVADEAEDIIDFHVVCQLGEGYHEDHKSDHMAALSSFCQDIDRVIEKIDSIMKWLTTMEEEWGDVLEQKPIASLLPSSSKPPFSGANTIVGFDEYLVQIMDKLTRDDSDLLILSIVEMGGIDIGKESKDHERCVTLSELGQKMYQNLFGGRYFIVMDDVWSIKVWEELKTFFPNNGNGSRVLVTTRLLNVARSLSYHDYYLTMNFLGEDKSWKLLCEKVFAQEGCPYLELEKIGKNIAKGCNGLPLAIVVIGGLLAKSNMTREYWKFVAENINTFANLENDEHCSRILSLSYNNLPIHLKACFLSLRVFPEDHKISGFQLIKLWVTEGILKPVEAKTLEEAAEEYLEELIDRNLIFIIERGYEEPGLFHIHDLLRDLCLREFHKEHFILVPRVQNVDFDKAKICFICSDEFLLEWIDLHEVQVASQSTSLISLLVCMTCKNMYTGLTGLRAVRMKYTSYINLTYLHPTKLRRLEVSCQHGLELTTSSTMLPLLWNLQILETQKGLRVLPYEIWDMPQLRHIDGLGFTLRDPIVAQDCIILENLQTLAGVLSFRCTEEVVKRMPNLKKLVIYYDESDDWSYYCLCNLVRLHKLEFLTLSADNFLLEHIVFPPSLKILELLDCRIPWENMTIIGSLPNLKVLNVYSNAFTGPEWNPVEGEFPQLEKLSIFKSHLVWWTAEDIHFPNLKLLMLSDMYFLVEIPLRIGDILTLQQVHLDWCRESVIKSAKQILEEQQNNENESLEVYVNGDKVIIS